MERYLHTAFSADPACWEHRTPTDHPERPQRLDVIINALTRAELMDQLDRLPARRATEKEILLCHTQEYYQRVCAEITDGFPCLSTGDTYVGPSSLEAALHAAGASLAAVDAVIQRRSRNAFCAVRPPGHHATADAGMGFCIFNNAAIAARYAQRTHGVERVLIVDWDVHHGNGTQDIFYNDGTVFYFSVHQSPAYPGTGREEERGVGPGLGTTMNAPLPSGAKGEEVLATLRSRLFPAMRSFKPELVIISAGFDARTEDPLGDFLLEDHDFEAMTTLVMQIAALTAGGRVVSILEGGYNLNGLAKAVAAHVRTLVEHP